jgi:hypothetical protein
MFALIAFVILLLAAVGVDAGQIDLFVLGLAFWALHFAWAFTPWRRG